MMLGEIYRKSRPHKFGGVQVTERDYGILQAVVARGYCPYCANKISKRYGNLSRHIRKCAMEYTLLGRERAFSFWIAEAKESGRV